MLSMAGRVILSQAVISAIPSYVMQGCMLPSRVLNSLDKINRNFVWGSTDSIKKMYKVNWKKVTKPKAKGGLGLQEAKGRNLMLAAKLSWRRHHCRDVGWAEVLHKKYQTPKARRKGAHSRVWTAIKKGEAICELGSKWIIGSNSMLSCWHNKWLNAGCLRSLIEGPLTRGEENILDIKHAILSTPLRRFSDREDLRSWTSNLNGGFDPKNAYLLAVGDEGSPEFKGKWIWKLKTLPKIQMFLWKCLHQSLSVKSVLSDRGIFELGGCDSCSEDRGSILHVLRECPIAQNFWSLAGCPPELRAFFSLELDRWLHLNAKSSSSAVDKDYDCQLEKKDIGLKEIRWTKPADGWYKLNTDGPVTSANGLAGFGRLIRDRDGQWVAGFAKKIDAISSLAVVLWGLREGLALCVDIQAQAVEVEIDAAATIFLISCNSRSNGDFSGLVDDCRDLLLQLPQAKVSHCYRKVNFCADALAKLGASSSDGGSRFAAPLAVVNPFLLFDSLGLYRNRLCPNVCETIPS
ncbi:hypothetical protein SO802_007056 [Lithocarpus litseifolius]|uniref:RNase H type-1 domain-containing protein n=1 Tax=Lithocarpus litseifolius TaxID=425828 RepID=A0AAW2DQV3_9ROSI